MTPRRRDALILVVSVGVAFGIGFAWQATQARQARLERDATRQEIAGIQRERGLEQVESALAMATVAAQVGDFERSRQLASDFFALLQERVGTAPAAAQSSLNDILARRDSIITVLSRANPQAGSAARRPPHRPAERARQGADAGSHRVGPLVTARQAIPGAPGEREIARWENEGGSPWRASDLASPAHLLHSSSDPRSAAPEGEEDHGARSRYGGVAAWRRTTRGAPRAR